MSQKILVVDDSRTVRKVVEWVFHGSPWTVLTAATASEATDVLRAERPDVALIDYHLPDQSGLDFCREVSRHSQLSGTKLIVLAGTYHAFDEGAVEPCGAVDFIYKPFKTDALIEKVSAAAAHGARGAAPDPSAARPAGMPPLPAAAPPAAPAPPSAPAPLPPAPSPPSSGFTRVPPTPLQPPAPPSTASTAPAAPAAAPVATPAPAPSATDVPIDRAVVNAAIREAVPGIVKEVLAALLRQTIGPRVEEYAKRKINDFVERELPKLAEDAIEAKLEALTSED